MGLSTRKRFVITKTVSTATVNKLIEQQQTSCGIISDIFVWHIQRETIHQPAGINMPNR